jgi:hypothetical protein
VFFPCFFLVFLRLGLSFRFWDVFGWLQLEDALDVIEKMVAKKRKSKRQTLQQKYKIVKRTREHHRKLKKGKLSGGLQLSNKKKKAENRIPNAWPYKEELLQEIQTAKIRLEEQKQKQKENRQNEIVGYSLSLYCVQHFNRLCV